jgi:hypothetical protein
MKRMAQIQQQVDVLIAKVTRLELSEGSRPR